jgi:hypothetical protein
MFKTELKTKLSNIFGLKRVTFDFPGEAKEQDILFINIDSVISSAGSGKAKAKVKGELSIFADTEKLPFGFFNKKINLALNADTIDLFFYEFDQNGEYFGNLVERKVKFVYFYNKQYDPDQGLITSITFNEVNP